MWTCPKCHREFFKTNQSHSCREPYPLEKHFAGRIKAKELYDFLKSKIESDVGPFTIDSRECCIHFVNTRTFTACWPLKDKIRIDFSLNKEIKTKQFYKITKISANKYIHYLDINNKNQINSELLAWIKDSYK
jgi:hypothetical protein